MIFNPWRPAKYIKPKEAGYYQCTVQHGGGENIPKVMELCYTYGEKWINHSRQNVFDGYKVYQACRAPIDANLVHTDTLCERIDVIAWRKIPKPCRLWRMKENE